MSDPGLVPGMGNNLLWRVLGKTVYFLKGSAHPSTAIPLIVVTLLLWPSCYYGHFILGQTNAQSVIFIIKDAL